MNVLIAGSSAPWLVEMTMGGISLVVDANGAARSRFNFAL